MLLNPYNVHCTLYSVQCTLYIVQCITNFHVAFQTSTLNLYKPWSNRSPIMNCREDPSRGKSVPLSGYRKTTIHKVTPRIPPIIYITSQCPITLTIQFLRTQTTMILATIHGFISRVLLHLARSQPPRDLHHTHRPPTQSHLDHPSGNNLVPGLYSINRRCNVSQSLTLHFI